MKVIYSDSLAMRYNLSVLRTEKKSAWEAWKSYLEVTQAFLYMARHLHAPLTAFKSNQVPKESPK